MLKISNLSFLYLSQIIFENINLSIDEGMRVALIGDNGSGKTTLLNLIAGELNLRAAMFLYREMLLI
ncbi:MAG: ATP-binding cassette domain-containing protein [Campylobacteraceae bacterium]|jgi:ATPase subunit of ABC transporter with duplicated ATPase domains|nr:ATP-binding cassette domain-containing protein [Campylobacteraceae bacterium]